MKSMRGGYKRAVNQAFGVFYSGKEGSFRRNKDWLYKDITMCFVKYKFTPRDYFLFGFSDTNTSWRKRKTFVSDTLKDYMLDTIEGHDKYLELSDKYGFYCKTKKYQKREVFLFEDNTTEEDFIKFAVGVKDLFIKHNSGSYGQGAFVAIVNKEQDAKELYAKLKTGDSWIIEERIRQNYRMAKWNESSVNTVRINSYLNKSGFYILAPFVRFGRAGSVVDNGGAGGIYALIDEKNGEIISDGGNEIGDIYKCHPDSKNPIKGEFIPEWKDLISLVESAHRKCMPHHIDIGWDCALTDKGWIIIEGNWGQFICQQSVSKCGYKKPFEKYMKGGAVKN